MTLNTIHAVCFLDITKYLGGNLRFHEPYHLEAGYILLDTSNLAIVHPQPLNIQVSTAK